MELLHRKIQEQKFYKTLPSKIDNAVEKYEQTATEPDSELEWYFEETGSFGQEGWTISYRYKSKSDKSSTP